MNANNIREEKEGSEYGGYLPLDISGKEFFSDIPSNRILRFNAARYAALYAFRLGKYKQLWIPEYMCPSVFEAALKMEIPVCTYHIDENMEPDLERIGSDDCIFITNFFGIKKKEFYEGMVDRYVNVIFDNTQAFFSTPIWKLNVYSVYSPRKFVGVPDGGYLLGLNLDTDLNMEIRKDCSSDTALYLLSSLEKGTNSVYNEYLKNEERISNTGIAWMSTLTKILCSLPDYDLIRYKRQRNFNFLNSILGELNSIEINDVGMEEVPFVYPFLNIDRGSSFRKYLIENKVYVSQWWKRVLEKNPSKWERKLCEFLCPLCIDQRYDECDLTAIVNIVKGFKG